MKGRPANSESLIVHSVKRCAVTAICAILHLSFSFTPFFSRNIVACFLHCYYGRNYFHAIIVLLVVCCANMWSTLSAANTATLLSLSSCVSSTSNPPQLFEFFANVCVSAYESRCPSVTRYPWQIWPDVVQLNCNSDLQGSICSSWLQHLNDFINKAYNFTPFGAINELPQQYAKRFRGIVEGRL